ncbi:MAG: Gfo/Idh/MocA family protein [Microbacterium gubbeenense]|uniref:Gfo/Idh/MocA family protein n=1 Tax=Microbacterium gubbeenense TaxID=159896 RepID=UPI003F9B78C4
MSTFRTIDHDRPLRIVQAGAGGMGRAWLRTIAADPTVELVGLVDLNLDTAREALAELGISGVALGMSVSEVAAQTGADSVVNVTIPVAHLPVNREALAAGLPVLCEKPAAPSVRDAYRQAAAAHAGGQLLMISQSRRYFAALDAARAELPGIGQVTSVATQFFREAHFPGFREEMAHPLLIDMAIHQFDVARAVIGSEPVSVVCDENNPSWSWFDGAADAHAVFEFAGGARYVFTGSWVAVGDQTAWNGEWRIDGEGGTIRWDGADAVSVIRPGSRDAPERIDVPSGVPEEIAGSLREFVACLRSGARPENEAALNVASLAMVEAAVRSAETGARVDIAEVRRAALAEAIEIEEDPATRAVLEEY